MLSRTGQAVVRQASFNDFEAYESAAQGWNWTLRKFSADPFSGRLLQVSVGPVRIAFSQLDTSIAMSGAAQPGLASFGIPLPGSPSAMWCRQKASSRAVSVFESSGEFEAVTRPGFDNVVFSVEPDHFDEMAESLGYDTPRRIFPCAEVTSCNPEHLWALHQLLHQIRSHLAPDFSPGLREALEFELPQRLLGALAEKAPVPRPVELHLRQRALRRALAYIERHPREPIGVQDLCRSTGASARTLRRAFAEELGVAPKAYLQAHRLNGVQRELRCSEPGENSINETAHRWGFWHMSQFAADYRRWFGKLPSETLRRPPDAGMKGKGETGYAPSPWPSGSGRKKPRRA